jgi:uncharacterized protein with NRDE domain
MCTLVILYRPGHDWPVIIGANRDEMVDRPWLPPGRHWADRPYVTAGMDKLAGGSWLGVNDAGLLAAVNNRAGSLGPDAQKRSRGELILEALDHYTAADAADALSELNPTAYRPFNLLLADNASVIWVRHANPSNFIERHDVPPGLSMLTAHDINDTQCPRIRTYLPRFERAEVPRPDEEKWSDWEVLFSAREVQPEATEDAPMLIRSERGFATVSSSMIALSSQLPEAQPLWNFARRYPTIEPYSKISFS